MNASDTEKTGSRNLICIFVTSSVTYFDALQKYLPGVNDSELQVTNAYFSACATVKQLRDDAVNEQHAEPLLQTCTAVLIVVGSVQELQHAKAWWQARRKLLAEQCVRLLVLDFSVDEDHEQSLRCWGVENDIELLTDAICAEDNISIATRVRDALDCANWVSRTVHDKEDNEKTHDVPDLKVPTRLRRGLGGADIARITEELLELADSDDDSTQDDDVSDTEQNGAP